MSRVVSVWRKVTSSLKYSENFLISLTGAKRTETTQQHGCLVLGELIEKSKKKKDKNIILCVF